MTVKDVFRGFTMTDLVKEGDDGQFPTLRKEVEKQAEEFRVSESDKEQTLSFVSSKPSYPTNLLTS